MKARALSKAYLNLEKEQLKAEQLKLKNQVEE